MPVRTYLSTPGHPHACIYFFLRLKESQNATTALCDRQGTNVRGAECVPRPADLCDCANKSTRPPPQALPETRWPTALCPCCHFTQASCTALLPAACSPPPRRWCPPARTPVPFQKRSLCPVTDAGKHGPLRWLRLRERLAVHGASYECAAQADLSEEGPRALSQAPSLASASGTSDSPITPPAARVRPTLHQLHDTHTHPHPETHPHVHSRHTDTPVDTWHMQTLVGTRRRCTWTLSIYTRMCSGTLVWTHTHSHSCILSPSRGCTRYLEFMIKAEKNHTSFSDGQSFSHWNPESHCWPQELCCEGEPRPPRERQTHSPQVPRRSTAPPSQFPILNSLIPLPPLSWALATPGQGRGSCMVALCLSALGSGAGSGAGSGVGSGRGSASPRHRLDARALSRGVTPGLTRSDCCLLQAGPGRPLRLRWGVLACHL